jgi:hypothetical protein
MGRAEKMDCGVNGEVIFTGATTEFQLKKGLTRMNFLFMQKFQTRYFLPVV